PAMAEAVLATGAQYALALKRNHGPLYAAAEAGFAAAADLPSFTTTQQAHGRHEQRRASVLPTRGLPGIPTFPGLQAVGRIDAAPTDAPGRRISSPRYFALSRPVPPTRLVEITRAHWGIENRLHWSLDVVFHEDDARSRKNHAPENLAVIRRTAHG